jgi:hypothetical protein
LFEQMALPQTQRDSLSHWERAGVRGYSLIESPEKEHAEFAARHQFAC